jgi:hypothetical protein
MLVFNAEPGLGPLHTTAPFTVEIEEGVHA